MGARLQTLAGELQTHEAELHLAARTDDVLAAASVVLHALTAGGADPDGGTLVHALHLSETGVPAVLEELQGVVDAVVVVAAVRARHRAFPLLQTLPAEVVFCPLISCAYGALDTQVGSILSLHIRVALWALIWKTVL